MVPSSLPLPILASMPIAMVPRRRASKPTSIYFVLTSSVEVPFDAISSFMVPMTQQGITLRATGTIAVRCREPAMLVAQFVGLPFDDLDGGIKRSVARSVERMLARLLTRRVVIAGSPQAIDDPAVIPQIGEEIGRAHV